MRVRIEIDLEVDERPRDLSAYIPDLVQVLAGPLCDAGLVGLVVCIGDSGPRVDSAGKVEDGSEGE